MDKSFTPEARKLYGRKKGRPLGKERTEALEALLPVLGITADELPEDHSLNPVDLFVTSYSNHVLEIGFGEGEHVAAMMKESPDIGFIGAEPFINGVAGLVKHVKDMPEKNLRILHDDGMKIARSLKPHSLSEIYILNPDPWPKKRHHNRRIVRPENLDVFAKILKPGGQLILSTDVPDLADWMVTHTFNHPSFDWEAKSASDFWTRPEGWHITRYEVKGANHSKRMCYLIFTRS